MSEKYVVPTLLKALIKMQSEEAAGAQSVEASKLDPRSVLLRQWQVERLQRTYSDFLEDKRFRPASQFFMSEVYAPRDFSQRDHDFERLHDSLARYVPEAMLRVLRETIELNRLTHNLDHDLLTVLVGELGMDGNLTADLYAQAYRLCDNYAAREQQIALLAHLVREVGRATKLPLVGVALRLARKPAQKAGWSALYDFLLSGYRASQPIDDISPLAAAIEQRELRILEQIYAGNPNPFEP
jgi:hypothetical protein